MKVHWSKQQQQKAKATILTRAYLLSVTPVSFPMSGP